jgi:signal peptidase I
MTTLEMPGPAGTASPTRADAVPRRNPWSMVASGALAVLMVALFALVAAVVVVPRAIGAVPLTVLTGSMQPALSPGDLVVVRPMPADDIRVGDVITFQPVSDDPTLVTHRVVGVTLGSAGVAGFTTQGDDNNAADAPIVADQVKGRVVYSVPLVGHLTNAALAPQLAAVAGVGLLGFGLVTVVAAHRTKDEQDTNEKEPS